MPDSEWRVRSLYERFARWLLMEGNRRFIAGCAVAGFFLATLGLVSAGIISVGPESPIQSILGSGVVAGLFSLISVTLTINQLISSRVFGAIDRFQQKYESGTDLRNAIADIADHPSPPVHTAEFISFVGATLQEQAETLAREYDGRDAETDERIASYVDDIDAYSDVVQEVSSDMPAETVISTLAGPDFAHHINATDELRSEAHEALTVGERETLDAIADLLGAITVFRQYFKTIALHQELARLSRQFVFVGFPAMAVAILAPLLYETSTAVALTSVPLELVMCVVLAVVIAPLALLMAYILRIATIFRYTVSVAPFVPPKEWPWSEEAD